MIDIKDLKKTPFNIDLLYVSAEDAKKLPQVTDLSIFDNTSNFSSKGLFSVEIFGPVGSEYRSRKFAYIDLNCEIIHPFVYYAVTKLKSLYTDIMGGKTLAIFDKASGEFIKSTQEDAKTGYEFFISHINDIKFQRNDSDKRNFLIELVEKAKKENKLYMRYHLVMPAGLRDYSVDESGKPQEDEINSLYRKLIYHTSLIDTGLYRTDKSMFDSIRYSVQTIALTIFDYVTSLLEGKHKLILGKWVTRKIFNSTRNVISSAIEDVSSVDDDSKLGYNETFVGLHQFSRMCMPKTVYEMRVKFLNNIFIPNNDLSILVDAKTLKRIEVANNHIQKDYDLWTTIDGSEKLVANFGNLYTRHSPVTLGGGKYYLALVYNDGKYFKVFNDINELPKELSSKNVSPITYAELFYLSLKDLSGKVPTLVTRYPIQGYGGIYPCFSKLRTTVKALRLIKLNDDWQPSDELYNQFPDRTKTFYDTVSVHNSHLAAMGADFDGDTISVTAVLSEEAKEEITAALNKKEYYLDPNNRFNFSTSSDQLKAVLAYIT
jgi:hypothetical protein